MDLILIISAEYCCRYSIWGRVADEGVIDRSRSWGYLWICYPAEYTVLDVMSV